MNIKNDCSYLFESLNNSSNSSSNIFNAIDLSEYSSIKSGTYGKLLKAYYAKNESSDETSDTTTKKSTLTEDTAVEKLTDVTASASTLEDSAEKLITKSTKNLFKEKEITTTDENGVSQTTKGYDTEAIYSAVSDFADKYNSFLKSMEDSDSAKIKAEIEDLTGIVADYKDALKEVGITINEDDTLSVDEDTFKAADMSAVKSIFNGNSSMTYLVSTKASYIGITANSEANTMKSYTSSGTYDQSLTSGSLLDSLI